MFMNNDDYGITQDYVDETMEGLAEAMERLSAIRHCLYYYANKQKQASDTLSPDTVALNRNGRTNETALEIQFLNGAKGISKSYKFSKVMKNKETALTALLFCDAYIAALCESTGASYEDFSCALRQMLNAVRHSQKVTCGKDGCCHKCNSKDENQDFTKDMKDMIEKDYPYYHSPSYNGSCESDYDKMTESEDSDKSYINKCFEQELREQCENREEYTNEEQTLEELRREYGEYGYSKETPHRHHHHHHRHHRH